MYIPGDLSVLTFLLVCITLTAFAANSILCRMALATDAIGPIEFTMVRLASGAIMLAPLLLLAGKVRLNGENPEAAPGGVLVLTPAHIGQAAALFGYALFFSLAYIELEAGTGALVLFPSVQLTMMGISVYLGNRVSLLETIGFALALCGLVYLMLPGASAPSLVGLTMMALSGISWGIYSMLGRNSSRPILATVRNFLFCLPACLVLFGVVVIRTSGGSPANAQPGGMLLAVMSGAVASGGGYVLWYISLRRISITVAAIGQLAVPILAATGGIIFLDESLTLRLILASLLILGGIVVAVLGRKRPAPIRASTVDN
jgi:drug/metabolite transporter (DMT)-like permease